jgi:L-ascorbate metabolism protein UlaG (beta-lactamase superfamily)
VSVTRYENLDGSRVAKGVGELLRWKLGRKPPVPPDEPTPFVDNDASLLAGAARPSLTFVGHATYLVQLGGLSLLTDPIWAERLAVVRRLTPPGIAFDRLPRVDVVLVSHNHRDHMDAATLERLSARMGRDLLYVVPKGLGRWFARRKLGRVVELGWWEHTDASSDVRITFVPSQHWSQRGPFDRNESLWGGFVVEGGGKRVYHSGDTAYFDGFVDIGERLGRIDAALLPIGAYEPRWFMKPQHMNPEDAAQAFVDLGASHLVSMHWGTFKLTDEALHAPPLFLREVTERMRIEEERVLVPSVGETVWLDRL